MGLIVKFPQAVKFVIVPSKDYSSEKSGDAYCVLIAYLAEYQPFLRMKVL